MEDTQIKQIIEVLIFATDKPLPLSQIDEVLGGVGTDIIKRKIEELNSEYEESGRPYRLKEIAGGFVMATLEDFAPWLKKLYKTQASEKLSGPALETLAIIAYRQPITKPDIETVRGVNVDGVLKTLLERGLVKISGRKDTPGRPFIYSTTREFLKHFGLGSLKELPPIEEFGLSNIQLKEVEPLISEELRKPGRVDEDEQES
jgi:segregation and condensation protein B